MSVNPLSLFDILSRDQDALLADWLAAQSAAQSRRDKLNEAEIRRASREFLAALTQALPKSADTRTEAWNDVRDLLAELSDSRASQGYSPSETATFVLSLKQPAFERLRAGIADTAVLGEQMWQATQIIDALALFTMEAYQKSREGVIQRQQQELMELSTPVVQLWQDILALPLIGTLDSGRTQIVMESLLEKIVATSASIAIIDITGVPTVDTLVAQHLMKTVAAARLMGADCIISGIRPQIAQTIVHLGVDLSQVTTKSSLADAFLVALQRTGSRIEGRKTDR